MPAVRHSIIAIALMLISAFGSITAALPAGTGGPWKPAKNVNFMNTHDPSTNFQTKLYPVKQGIWGGQSVSFSVEKDSVIIEFDCAEGAIPRVLKADKKGSFRVEGTFSRHMPGPARRDHMVTPQPAIYEGFIKGNVMTLTVTLKESNESLGKFTVERGGRAAITRCY